MSNPIGCLLVDDEFEYVGAHAPRQIGEWQVTIDSASIYNIDPEDVGRGAGGLLYQEPSETKRRHGYMVWVGGDNKLHFKNIDGVTELRDYLTAIIDSEEQP